MGRERGREFAGLVGGSLFQDEPSGEKMLCEGADSDLDELRKGVFSSIFSVFFANIPHLFSTELLQGSQ